MSPAILLSRTNRDISRFWGVPMMCSTLRVTVSVLPKLSPHWSRIPRLARLRPSASRTRLKGECIKVFVLLRAGHVASDTLSAALIEHVRRELGPIATPAALEFVSQLPKTRSGKIMRRYLKAKETGQEIGDISTMEQ